MASRPAPGRMTRTAAQSGRSAAGVEPEPEGIPGGRYLATDERVGARAPDGGDAGAGAADDDGAAPVAPAATADPVPTALLGLALAVHHARPTWPWVRCAAAARLALLGPALDRLAAALACGDDLGRAVAEAAAHEHDRRARTTRGPERGLDSWASPLLLTPRAR